MLMAADVLNANRVLGPAHGVHDGARLIRNTGSAVGFIDFEQVFLGSAGDAGDGVQVIARVMLFQKLKDASRILKSRVFLGNPFVVLHIGPEGGVVSAFVLIKTGEKTILEVILFADDETDIGVVDGVFFKYLIVIQNVL